MPISYFDTLAEAMVFIGEHQKAGHSITPTHGQPFPLPPPKSGPNADKFAVTYGVKES